MIEEEGIEIGDNEDEYQVEENKTAEKIEQKP